MARRLSYEELERQHDELKRDHQQLLESKRAQYSHLQFMDVLEQIDGIIRGAVDLDQVLARVLEALLEIFSCDRAWLLYPCDPDAESWHVPMECSRPEYPGVLNPNQHYPVTEELVQSFRAVLDTAEPVVFHPKHGLPVADAAQQFSIQSSVNTAICPRVGKPWMFGISQCSHARCWQADEIDIFQAIGRRLSDSLSTLLTLRDLRQSEERYRKIYENFLDIYFVTSLEGVILEISPSATEHSGYTQQELIGKMADFLYRDFSVREKMLQQLKSQGKVRGFEVELKKKNGELMDISVNADLTFDPEGAPTGLCGTLRDITLQKRLNEQLQRSRKMESLGLMAGGIAHDLNNILTGMVSYPDLILMELPPEHPLRKHVEAIKDSGQRAADVVADLLTVARGVASGAEVLNFNTVIREYLSAGDYRRLVRDHHEVEFLVELDSALLNVSCSSSHVKKILMNLATNAAQAIAGSGRITVKTENRYLEGRADTVSHVPPGEYVVLSVSDSGVGISPEDLGRIFEPFYTKRIMGRAGTGLGLSVVWTTVQDHGGHIEVNSDETGTRFDLFFPVSREEVTTLVGPIPWEEYRGKGQRILVVDDEKIQRQIATSLLSRLGYTVEAVSSGELALEFLSEGGVDLLVLDMIMDPGISGDQTYERARQLHPGQRAIIVSGFAATEAVIKTQALGAGLFLEKPYTMVGLGVAVRDELARK